EWLTRKLWINTKIKAIEQRQETWYSHRHFIQIRKKNSRM
ncbi:5381_t:CDS:2, partial [Funneliformis caledonium]